MYVEVKDFDVTCVDVKDTYVMFAAIKDINAM